jgi:hypothetical protein
MEVIIRPAYPGNEREKRREIATDKDLIDVADLVLKRSFSPRTIGSSGHGGESLLDVSAGFLDLVARHRTPAKSGAKDEGCRCERKSIRISLRLVQGVSTRGRLLSLLKYIHLHVDLSDLWAEFISRAERGLTTFDQAMYSFVCVPSDDSEYPSD